MKLSAKYFKCAEISMVIITLDFSHSTLAYRYTVWCWLLNRWQIH